MGDFHLPLDWRGNGSTCRYMRIRVCVDRTQVVTYEMYEYEVRGGNDIFATTTLRTTTHAKFLLCVVNDIYRSRSDGAFSNTVSPHSIENRNVVSLAR